MSACVMVPGWCIAIITIIITIVSFYFFINEAKKFPYEDPTIVIVSAVFCIFGIIITMVLIVPYLPTIILPCIEVVV